MRTVVVGPRPAELDAVIDRRRKLGLDVHDEVWEGELHMVPAPGGEHAAVQMQVGALLMALAHPRGCTVTGPTNIGDPGDYRVPDVVVFRSDVTGTFHTTALIVVEVLSPDDEAWEKFAFYGARGIEEVFVVDPSTRTVRIFRQRGPSFAETSRSAALAVDAGDIAAAIRWPRPPER